MEHTTSLSLARALAVGCLSGLDVGLTSVDVWDPAVGSGLAGHLLVSSMEAAGVQVRYRGQDINESAVAASRRRFAGVTDAQVAVGDTLAQDAFDDFAADLVIVDAPWGMDWRGSAAAVDARRASGAFGFGLPHHADSEWLFISLALEKLHPASAGGGRVAALIRPGALSDRGSSAVRRAIVEAGLLESVTRLPEGLAPNTSIPLYLLTFTNRPAAAQRVKVKVADLQTQFTTEHRRRSIPDSALQELESGLRTGRPGPRNRIVGVGRFTRRDARLVRVTEEGQRLSWTVTAYDDTVIDDAFLEARYGSDSGVEVDGDPSITLDLNPSPIFGDDSQELLKEIARKGWPSRRLSGLLTGAPETAVSLPAGARRGHVFIPTQPTGRASGDQPDPDSAGLMLSVELDGDLVQPGFLAAWLNSEQGIASRRRAIEAASPGAVVKTLRRNTSSLMRWADELIVPAPSRAAQLALATADNQLGSFMAELNSHRSQIWDSPDSAETVVSRVSLGFDDSLSTWLDRLPFPIASALWTAETMTSPGDQQRAYIHAWEAIVAFHATVLLSACRSDPGHSRETESEIRQTLHQQNLRIERASFGTWTVIAEKTSKDLRRTFDGGDPDEIARVRRVFGDLPRTGIERLISKEVVGKFKEVNGKRNRWLGHGGNTSAQEHRAQVVSLVSDLSDLRQLLGDVWAQLHLVRAGSAKRGHEGFIQDAEVAVGTRSPFRVQTFNVGDAMLDGQLYLLRDGSQSPLRLGRFVQLRAAPRDAHYTTYFYNRTDGPNVQMVSYQHGPHSELEDDAERFRDEFGALTLR